MSRLRFSHFATAVALLAPVVGHAQSLRTGTPSLLLRAEFATSAPRWSPDGARVAFTTPDYSGLWVADADGENVTQLSDASAVGFSASWSPDGSSIVARASRDEGVRRLHAVTVFDLASGSASQLGDERALMPSTPVWLDDQHVGLDQDGRLEVLALSLDSAPASFESRIMPVSGGGLGIARSSSANVDKMSPLGRDATVINVTPSPDGQRVAFEAVGGSLYVVDADGSDLIDLGTANRPSWSPDGQWLVAMVTEDNGHAITASDLVAIRADGSGRVALTETSDRLEMNPSWSPDGRRIAYDDMTDGALYILPVRD